MTKKSQVMIPQLVGISECYRIREIYAPSGKFVQVGEEIALIENDDCYVTLESFARGTIHQHYKEGDEVRGGTAIAEVREKGTRSGKQVT